MSPAAATETDRAHAFLLGAGAPLDGVVAAHGPLDPYDWPGIPVDRGDLLGGLTLHIVSQQISVTVALLLFERLKLALGGRIDAVALAAASDEALRGAGLSGAKSRTLSELGARIVSGDFSLEALLDVDDAEAAARLTSLRGVGPWSSQMFLLHELRRPDVFPAGDVALRHAIASLDGLEGPPDPKLAAERAASWTPYRSYAAAHLWQLVAKERPPPTGPRTPPTSRP